MKRQETSKPKQEDRATRATQTTHHRQASKQTMEQLKAKANQIKETTITEGISHLKNTSQE
jgi:hypothetical protein